MSQKRGTACSRAGAGNGEAMWGWSAALPCCAGFHKAYLEAMVHMFGRCTEETVSKLNRAIDSSSGKVWGLQSLAAGASGTGCYAPGAQPGVSGQHGGGCMACWGSQPVSCPLSDSRSALLPPCTCHLAAQAVVDMETEFLNLGLDIIGLGVFNYDFGSITAESPVIKARAEGALPTSLSL